MDGISNGFGRGLARKILHGKVAGHYRRHVEDGRPEKRY